MAIPLVVWAVGALGGAAYLSRTYDDVLDIFTGDTAEDKLRKQLEQEGTLQITNLPKFPAPAAPSQIYIDPVTKKPTYDPRQLEAMIGTGAGQVTWTPLSLQAADQQRVADYKASYEPVIATVGGQPKPTPLDPVAIAALIAAGVGAIVIFTRR